MKDWRWRCGAGLVMLLATHPVLAGVRLYAEPPDGWVRTYQINLPRLRLVEFSPPEEDGGAWRERWSVEAFSLAPGLDPIALLAGVDAEQRGACDDYRSQPVRAGYEFGLPVAVRLLICGKSPRDDGQVSLVKVVQGSHDTFVILRAWRLPAFGPNPPPLDAQAMAGAARALAGFRVCDAAAPANDPHRCADRPEVPPPGHDGTR